ncbi:MAG: U32 family peptidase [Erysipelotrichaceae bacterium]|nr:U32 family peptidase [Erysipelotrichaceae bacterium]
MKRIELLAPAGNYECFLAAVNNGADAVYMGGKNFSARAFAGNFSNDELAEAIKYAHLHRVRIFVTLNTLLNEFEFDNAIKMADYYYETGVDALLVQDLGLYYVLKNKYPDFELHCSTQMHVHNLEGIKTAKKLGFKRVVVARESDLDFIRQACREGIEIETFVHGALCVSYSGQCLMSSYAKHRSANKGMCAQCCRLRYDLLDKKGHKVKTMTDYLLSPKDMFLLEDLPELIEAGVSSFKIEGRMKSPAYVGYVTSVYRQAIDAAMQGKEFKINAEKLEDLKVLFNRGFSNDLLYGRKELFGQKTPNHLGVAIGEVVNVRNGLTYIHLDKDLEQFDGIRIGDDGFIVNKLYVDGLLVSSASAGSICAVESDKKYKGLVYKTQDHLLEKQIAQTPEKKLPLDMDIAIYPDKKVTVRLKCYEQVFDYTSEICAQKALKAPLNDDSIRKQFGKLNETLYYLNDIKISTDNAFLPLKDLNQIRREAIEAFNAYRLASFKREKIECQLPEAKTDSLKEQDMDQTGDTIKMNDRTFALNYVINPESQYATDDRAVICEFGGLLKDYEEKIAYYTLNCCNSYTYEFLKRLGFDYVVLSSELQPNEIKALMQGYEKRNGIKIRPFVFSKGDRVLMYIKSDPFKDYAEDLKGYSLNDGTNTYRIEKHGEITQLIQTDHKVDISDLSVSSLTVSL